MRVTHSFFIFNTIFIYCLCLSNHGSQSHPLSVPQKKTKQTLRENGVCGGGNLSSWKLQYDTLSLLVNSFTIGFSMQVFDVKNHWSGFKDPGLCYTVMLALSGILPGYCFALLCHWEPAAPSPQNRPHLQSQSLLQHMTDVFEVGSRPG